MVELHPLSQLLSSFRRFDARCKYLSFLSSCSLLAAVLMFASTAAAQTVRLRTSGMFRLDVVLNGHFRTSALVDTGATSVYVCDRVAKVLKLKPGEVVTVRTTSGQVSALRTTIEVIQIGTIVIHDIAAVMHPGDSDCNEILLGLSALRKLEFGHY